MLNRNLRFFAFALAVVLLPALTSGCEMKLGGMTIDEAFAKEPKVAVLVHAACDGDVAKMESAIRGVDVNFVGAQGGTPLAWVVAKHSLKGAETLLRRGADPNYRLPGRDTNYKGPDGTPLVWIVSGGNDLRMLELFLHYKGDPNALNRDQSALMIAASNQRTENVQLLLKYGADINKVVGVADDAFGSAVGTGRYDIAYLLLEKGFRVNLESAARGAAKVRIDTHSEQWKWKLKVLEKLTELGAHPPPPSETQPLPKSPFKP